MAWHSSWMNSGDVPQQPPRMRTPSWVKGTISRANSAAVMVYSLVWGSGRPALGLTTRGKSVHCRSSSARDKISAGPREQLNPTASTPSPSRVIAIAGTVVPVKVRRLPSKLMVARIGRWVCSLAAKTAAFMS